MTARITILAAERQRRQQRRVAWPDTAMGQAAAENARLAANAEITATALGILDQLTSDMEPPE